MRGFVTTCDGTVLELPPLLSWELRYTGGVPCDSFSLRCLYDESMAELPDTAYRFTAIDGMKTVFFGVVDETEITCDRGGRTLFMSGRGLAALLLDNETEAVTYQRATTDELVRRHVTPYGIRCGAIRPLTGTAPYHVESGSSEWKAISGFTERCGGFSPYFLPDGTLLCAPREPQVLKIDDRTPLLGLSRRVRRCGVLSEVRLIDRRTGRGESVCNDAFRAQGGQCRRVLYVPSNTTADSRRYTGAYQIAQSARDAEEVTLRLIGGVEAQADDAVLLTRAAPEINGRFRIAELLRRFGAGGETTELTLRKE